MKLLIVVPLTLIIGGFLLAICSEWLSSKTDTKLGEIGVRIAVSGIILFFICMLISLWVWAL